MVVISEQAARTLDRLDSLVADIISGEIKGFVVFAERDGGVTRLWQFPEGSDVEVVALAIKDFGHGLHLQVARGQGNAPPDNRSDRTQ